MNKCGNCKHWKEWKVADVIGDCERIVTANENPRAIFRGAQLIVNPRSDIHNAKLVTAREFHCPLWEAQNE